MQTAITTDLIESALTYIPANCPRDEWAKILGAIKSEFDNDTGLSIAEDWSRTSDSFNQKSFNATWKSVTASGGVKIGTLLFIAQGNGFVIPKPDEETPPPDPEAQARLARERLEKQQAEKLEIENRHSRVALEADFQWATARDAPPPGERTYLDKKQVQPYGVKFSTDGWILVPLRDIDGKLWNIQRICPVKTPGQSDKLTLPGGRVSGLFHQIGDPHQGDALLIGEGYATVASLHECTGHPSTVAFNAGNLAHVAKALRDKYPEKLIVVCGDDDRQTFAKTGKNPGREKAQAAAKAVGGLAVFPADLPEDGKDFNDLHRTRGADAVARLIGDEIQFSEPPEAPQTAPQAAQKSKVSDRAKSKPRSPEGQNQAPDAGPKDDYFDSFYVAENGVFHNGVDRNGKRKAPEWICSRLIVTAATRDADGGACGYYLSFNDLLGHQKKWAMPAKMLSGDGGEYRAILLSQGLQISTSSHARNLLTEYLQTRNPKEFAVCTDRVGWHGKQFVLPKETIGTNGETIVFQSDSAIENTFRVKGDAAQWRERIGRFCVGNSRLAFSVSCAFAGPLLRPAGMESGGFHFWSGSSSGKTTTLKMAASVNGGDNYLQRWRSTDNALEATAAQHSDCLLILDELAQVDPRTAGECAYMLANESGKARASRTGTPRPRQAWRLLFLSAGEICLSGHMAEGGKRTRAGQEVRMTDINADAGQGLGIFENLHEFQSGVDLVNHLKNQVQLVYGATGRAWLEWLTSNSDSLKSRIRNASNELAKSMIPPNSAGQVERVGGRFALVGAAGELATEAGLTGWPPGESERAARACFNAWLGARGGNGNAEVATMLRQVRRFLETHAEGRFSMWHRAADDHSPKTLNRAGVRRMLNGNGDPVKFAKLLNGDDEYAEPLPDPMGENISFEYYILAETFKTEVCQGFDFKAVSRVLLEHGCLKPDKSRSFDCKPRLPGIGLAWCYRITPKIFELDI